MVACYFWRTVHMRCSANAVVRVGSLAYCGAHWWSVINRLPPGIRATWSPVYLEEKNRG